ncbi:MAG: hypothetical protein PHE83_07740 [Opitutaceae bacterium]|nr:hypothetical protein [Opitutaceae bacterium]
MPLIAMNSQRTAQRGSVVLVALCFTIVLAVAVASYVSLCARTMQLSNRSFCYTSSVHLAEIGMEEALWSLNQALNSSSYTWSGWTLAGSTATKTLADFTINQGVQGTVNITVSNYNTTDPFGTPSTITVAGIVQMTDGITIDKQISATVKPAVLFSNAVGSTAAPNSSPLSYWPYPTGNVAFVNNTAAIVDSYDSFLGSYTPSSTVNRSDQAIISGPFLQFSYTSVYGYATTANSTATTPTTSNSSITSLGGSGVNSSRISNNGNQRNFDIVTPSGSGSILPTSGSIGPGFYYYTAGTFSQDSSSVLTITGPATIYVSGSVDMWGSIVISASSTGPVQIYVGGQLYIYGPGIDNQTRKPGYLAIFGPSTWDGYLYTNTSYYGVIYMPNSVLYVWGKGYGDLEVYGSLVALNVIPYYSDHFKLHYDLNLRKTTFSLVNTPYDISQWIKN